jgi:diguanylate cyclase (GGDEF)-like protein
VETLGQLSELARRRGTHFDLLLIDLDRFKQINDTLGHDAGDALLIEAAKRLRAAVRRSDSVFRLGGDEFAILLPDSSDPDRAAVEATCRRIVDGFTAPIPFNGSNMKTSPSIGIASFPNDSTTQEGLYKAADVALYAAKQAGRNTWRWSITTMDDPHRNLAGAT